MRYKSLCFLLLSALLPGVGTGATIAGDDSNLALLAAWLGDSPVTAALKNAMVGVDKD